MVKTRSAMTPLNRTTAAIVLWLVAVGVCAGSLRANCTLPPQIQAEVQSFGKDGVGRYNRAISYYDFGCLDDAESDFKTAIEMLKTTSAKKLSDKVVLALARDGLALVNAQQLLRRGDKATAVAKMLSVATGADSLIKLRALVAIVPLIDPQSAERKTVEKELDTLAARGYWQAEKVLVQGDVARGQAVAASARLEQRMAAVDTIHDAFATAILLADVWRGAGRTLEAWLLIRRIDPDAGTDLLDPELRVEFLRVAATVATARASTGDPDAARAKTIYESALREVQPR